MCKKAIVTGASSGIGRALALKLVAEGYKVGIAARREERLREMQRQHPEKLIPAVIDVTEGESCREKIEELIERLGGLDLCIANAGIGRSNPDFELAPELETIEVNVVGFVATLEAAARFFKQQGRGHLVGVSSVAALRGNARAPAYNATKAFEANYLEGLRINLSRFNIAVTDIRPGYVYTEMTEQNKSMFWVATPERAAESIYKAILKKKRVTYITPRWRLLAGLEKLIPFSVWRRAQIKRIDQ